METKISYRFPRSAGKSRNISAILATGLVGLVMTGCAAFQGNHVIVGSIPDDYRTRHPIVISEQEQAVDIPVASSDRGLTQSMRETVRGASDRYQSTATGTIQVMSPTGAPNSVAASLVSQEIVAILKKEGIPANRILTTRYPVSSPQDAAPIRISFLATTASTGDCGRWSEDMLAEGDENRNYKNFGCSSQNNLAAQIVNPGDLLGPRGMTSIDAERRGTVIESFRTNGAGLTEN